MERTKTDAETILWKRVGNKPMIFKNRHIKPNQTFKAKLEDIPEAFRDLIIPVDAAQAKQVEAKMEVDTSVDLEYFVKSRGAGYYNVVDGDGKVQNEKALRKDAAEELLKSLKGE